MRALWVALLLAVALGAAPFRAANAAPAGEEALGGALPGYGGQCGAAIQAAQNRHLVPAGLLYAIGQVESGRPDPVTHRLVPWPWTVQAQNQSHYFATKAEAVAWVQAAQAQNIFSIDVGCMQINLMYHPAAFQNLDEAFDPSANAEYAARFLISLHAQTGDWQKASGLYHSQTLALAIPYAQKVEAALTGRMPPGWAAPAPPKPTMLSMLQAAWGATMASPSAGAILQQATLPLSTPVAAWGSLAPAGTATRHHLRRFHSRQAPVLLSYEH